MLHKGRGAQIQTKNSFLKQEKSNAHVEGIDDFEEAVIPTKYLQESAKSIVNRVKSPDIGPEWSLNPYQGCEHGCIYCYARNAHEYYGFSAGLDFETNIMVKKNAPELLRAFFDKRGWVPAPIVLSGNTDCYQPAEKKLGITRKLLEVFLEYKNPVGIITKNSLVLRDADILTELAKLNLVHVNLSITSLNEETRLKLEPRTATAKKRLQTVSELAGLGIPVRVMAAPLIPFINMDELPSIMQAAADAGASDVAYTLVRLNGSLAELFTDWIRKQYPDKAERVLAQIKSLHGGRLNNSEYGKRMRGSGELAEITAQQHKLWHKRLFADKSIPAYDLSLFKRPESGQLQLF